MPDHPINRVVVSAPATATRFMKTSSSSRRSFLSRAGLVGEFGVEKFRGEIVGGMVDAPVDELREHLAVGERAVGVVGHLAATLGAHVPVAVLLDRR